MSGNCEELGILGSHGVELAEQLYGVCWADATVK
jgi:hypothetical protein